MNQKVLNNFPANSQLMNEGYTVVNFAEETDIDELYRFYEQHPYPTQSPFHTTHFSTDTAYKTSMHQYIVSFLQKALQNQFVNHVPVFANFMVKEGGGGNPMPLHADWTYVEEDVSQSFAVWIPLIDTDVQNGCIGVIPFSCQLSHKIRGPRILQWEAPIGDLLIEKMGKLIPMKKGQALIYNHRTLHYSPPNNSQKIRPAINISLVPQNEPVIHYTIPEGENKILKFIVDDETFFLYYNNFQMPFKGKKVSNLVSIPELINLRVPEFISMHHPATITKN